MASSILCNIFIFIFLFEYCCRADVINRTSEHQSSPILPYSAECGVTRDSRVLKGVEAKPGTWNWIAALVSNNGENFCAGSLITRKHVLTTATCLERRNPDSFRVRLGAHKLGSLVGDSDARDYEVMSFKIHPGYNNYVPPENDIALLTLKEEAQTPSSVQPICLPTSEEETFFGQNGTIIGWGLTAQGGSTSKVLLQASLPIWNNTDCSHAYSMQLNETVMCAGYREGGTDTCQGDSGAPLMVRSPQNKWMVAGIVSWGIGCGLPNKPGVYTRVGPYLDWIGENRSGSDNLISSVMPSKI